MTMSKEDFMKLFTFLGIGFVVTFSIILINFITIFFAKADKEDDWFIIPLIQNTILAIGAITCLIAHNIGLW